MSGALVKSTCLVVMATLMLTRSIGTCRWTPHDFMETDYDFANDRLLSIHVTNSVDESRLRMILDQFRGKIFQLRTRPFHPPKSDVNQPTNGVAIDVHVIGHVVREVEDVLTSRGLSFKILTENLKSLIAEERKENRRIKRSNEDKHNLIDRLVGFYPDFDEVTEWLENITTIFPTLTSLVSLGKTYEGRDIHLIKISANAGTRKSRPGFWIDSGIHAREWIGVSTSLFIIAQLLKVMTGSCTLASSECGLLQNFDWYVAPVLNPDGYAFTHSDPDGRFWRKNRSKRGGDCVGVDLNRNFDVEWGKYFTSTNVCSQLYGGPHAESENETVSLVRYWSRNKKNLHAWLTLHSFGQLLMNRWSSVLINWTREYNETLLVMKEAAQKIFDFNGNVYRAGSSPEVLYSFSGGSADWFRNNTDVMHVYEMELRGNDSTTFILPASEIIPTGDEALRAVLAIGARARGTSLNGDGVLVQMVAVACTLAYLATLAELYPNYL